MEDVNIVLGVIGLDCHSVANRLLYLFLQEQGFHVHNLGVMVSADEFIDAALETSAKAILIGSLYGQAEIDCTGFKEKCIDRGLSQVLRYIGGNLVIGKSSSKEIKDKFTLLGFDQIFIADTELETVSETLLLDLEKKYECG